MGPEMLPLIIGGLVIVSAMWWLYSKRENADLVEDDRTIFIFGCDRSESSDRTVGLLLSAAVVIFLLCLGGLHAIHADRPAVAMVPVIALSAAAVAEHVVDSSRKVSA